MHSITGKSSDFSLVQNRCIFHDKCCASNLATEAIGNRCLQYMEAFLTLDVTSRCASFLRMGEIQSLVNLRFNVT